MKNKNTLILLLVLVLLIWGYIGYKVFFELQVNPSIPTKQGNNQSRGGKKEKKELVYHHNYTNPFLKEKKNYVVAKFTSAPTTKTVPEIKKTELEIKVNGIIINGTVKTVYVTSNNQSIIAKEGDSLFSKYVISKINMDSIQLKSKGTFKWIKK